MCTHASEWFNLFGLQEIPFDYVTNRGLSLTGGPVTLASLSTSSRGLRIESPNAKVQQAFSTMTSTLQNREARIHIAGYFGPGASANNVCYQSAAQYPYVSGVLNSSATSVLSYTTDGTGGTNAVKVFGGTQCTPSEIQNLLDQVFQSYLAFRPSAFNSLSWSEVPFNFYSIFMMDAKNDIDAGFAPFRISRVPATYDSIMSFKLLPGVNSATIDGLRVFKHVLQAGESSTNHSDDIPCAEMSKGMIPGFSQVFDMPVPANPAGQMFNIPLPVRRRRSLCVFDRDAPLDRSGESALDCVSSHSRQSWDERYVLNIG